MNELSDYCPQAIHKQQIILSLDHTPIPKVAQLHLFKLPLSMANVNYFKITYIFLLQTHCKTKPHQSQDGRHFCLLHLALLLVDKTACSRS